MREWRDSFADKRTPEIDIIPMLVSRAGHLMPIFVMPASCGGAGLCHVLQA